MSVPQVSGASQQHHVLRNSQPNPQSAQSKPPEPPKPPQPQSQGSSKIDVKA